LLGLAAVLTFAPLVGAACGDDTEVSTTLPPIVTTTTSTTVLLTTTTVPRYYTVQPGDILSVIAENFGVTMEEIMALNGISNPDHIEVGEELMIPLPGEVIPTTTVADTTVTT